MSAERPSSQDSPEAGPSSPRSPLPVIERDEATSRSIDASLAARRRRSSLSHALSLKKSEVTSRYAAFKQQQDGSVRPEEVVEGDEDEAVLTREEREEMERSVTMELERYREGLPGEVGVLKGGEAFDVEGDEAITGGKQQGYQWDVLFENQRGIYLFGKAYFSSQGLLPIDPSPYTLPDRPLLSASSFIINDPTTNSPPVVQPRAKPKKQSTRPIKTAYTIETFQTPSPAWTWLTPWMINMKVGTDESGWKYNAYFRSKGWGSHSGPAGWGGWVRRREWVRLRGIRPPETEMEEPHGRDPRTDRGLGKVLHDEGIEGVVKLIAREPLDRQKLETWRTWLDESNVRDRRKLQILLNKDHNVCRPFITV